MKICFQSQFYAIVNKFTILFFLLISETDGAADEAPRFPKTLKCAVSLFKEQNLDVLIHGVNAAGLSAFNPVERRMAPLSHDLSGIILPHDTSNLFCFCDEFVYSSWKIQSRVQSPGHFSSHDGWKIRPLVVL